MLSILICTINDRILNVPQVLLPEREDVRYVVSWQQTENCADWNLVAKQLSARQDVTLCSINGKGLSVNRNNALAHWQTEIALIADDDLRYSNEQIDKIIQAFDENPEADIITFQAINKNGQPIKKYASKAFDYAHQPYGNFYASWEIGLRKHRALPSFDTRFGLGSDYLAGGEEEVFLYEAYQRGLHILYQPFVICQVMDEKTTGDFFFEKASVRRTKGAVLYFMHGYGAAVLRCLKVAFCPPKRTSWHFMKDMLDGIRYIRTTFPKQ